MYTLLKFHYITYPHEIYSAASIKPRVDHPSLAMTHLHLGKSIALQGVLGLLLYYYYSKGLRGQISIGV